MADDKNPKEDIKPQDTNTGDGSDKNDKGDPSTSDDKGSQTVPYPRFKEVNDALQKANKTLIEIKEREKEVENKYQELAEKHKAEAEAAQSELQKERINNRIIAEAGKKGVVDIDAVLA